MDFSPLFVSYVYVNSASKIFESRVLNRGMSSQFPDFEAVYHLVIDAVETYNDRWESTYKHLHLSVSLIFSYSFIFTLLIYFYI